MVTERTYTIIDDLDFLPIFNFYRGISKDYRFLIRDYRFGDKLDDEDILKEAEIVFDQLYQKWCKLTENQDSVLVYLLRLEIDNLQRKIEMVPILVEQISKGKPKQVLKQYYEEMKGWGLPLDPNKSIADEVDRIKSSLRGTKTRLDMKIADYENEIKEETKKPLTLQRQKVILERNLGLSIDLRKTMVTEWISYVEDMKELSSKNPNRNGK